MTGGSISVLLADDNAIVRDGVRAILAIERDLERGVLRAITTR
jgi:hypothetical protein